MSIKPKFEMWCDQVRSYNFNSDLDIITIKDTEEYFEYDFDILAKEQGRGRGISIEDNNKAIGISKIRDIMRQMGYDDCQFIDDVPCDLDNPSNFEEAYLQEIAETKYKHFESGINMKSNDSSFGLYHDGLDIFDNPSDFRLLLDESVVHTEEKTNNDEQSLNIFECETNRTYNEAAGDPCDFRKGMEELSKPKNKNRRSIQTKCIPYKNEYNYEEEINNQKSLFLEYKLTESESNFKDGVKYAENMGYKDNDILLDYDEHDYEEYFEIKSNFKEAIDELENTSKKLEKDSEQQPFNSSGIAKSGDPGNFVEALKEVLKTKKTIQDESSSPDREPYYEYNLDYVNKEFRNRLRDLDLEFTNEIGNCETLSLTTPETDNTNVTTISTNSPINFQVDTSNFSKTVAGTSSDSDIKGRYIDDEYDYYGNKKFGCKSRSSSNIDISTASTSSTRYTYVPSYISESEDEFCPKKEDFPDLRVPGKRKIKSDQSMVNTEQDTSKQSSTKNVKTKSKTRKFVQIPDFFKTEESKTKPDKYIEHEGYSRTYNNAFDITLEDLNSPKFQYTMNRYDIDQQTPLACPTSTGLRRGGGIRRGTSRK